MPGIKRRTGTLTNFNIILCEVLEKHAPLKKKYVRANNSPFMTKQLRKMIMNRSRSKNNFYKNKTSENWEKYRQLRNECVKLTKKVKKEYFQNLNINLLKDNKTFWKTVRPYISDKCDKKSRIILVEKNEIISDDKEVAEIMNDYFVNITKDLNIPKISRDKTEENSHEFGMDPIDQIITEFCNHPSILKIKELVPTDKIFSFDKVVVSQIEKEILELNTRKAAGYDAIPPKIVKDSVNVLKYPLTQLFNNSITECIYPTKLKFANVTPLFKLDDTTEKGNYRPISILPSISKIFGRLLFQQVNSFIINIISPYLCGFRKGYSAQHVLLRLKDRLNKSLDNKQMVGLLMMDLSKAFDCINHDLLIAKLHAYGFGKDALKLIYSYIKGRHQRVKMNTALSSWKELITGVAQGSVLGPLLFNLFINDLVFFIDKSELYNYADDNTLSVADTNIEIIIRILESDAKILSTWFDNNGMLLNAKKCKFLVVESAKSSRSKTAAIKVQNKIVSEENEGKMLGITFDNNITMHEHIKNICKKAGSKLNAIARISYFLNEHKRKVLMKSFVMSQFNYCPIIWMYCQRRSNNMINRIHERSLRIAYNDYISDFNSLLKKDNSVTIHQRNIQALTIEIHKTIHKQNPSFMENIFSIRQHKYSTGMQNLVHPKPRTVTYGTETFGYKGNQIWNTIPTKIQNNSDINVLKEYISKNNVTCNCNLCKLYIPNLGYVISK